MAVNKALRRLLRVRDLEEEQRRLALTSVLAELHSLEAARDSARGRERQGRELVRMSVQSGKSTERLAGLMETAAAGRRAAVLAQRIAAAETAAAQVRHKLLEKRVERRQAETLIVENEARDMVELDRQRQRNVDDWYGSRKYREQAGGEPR